MPNPSSNIESCEATPEIAVDFAPPCGGKIGCRIRPIHEGFGLTFTHDRDPFLAMLAWLEDIASGASSSVWLIFEDKGWSRLQFYGATGQFGDHQDLLVHVKASHEGGEILSTPVVRRELVLAFYRAFVALPQNVNYRSLEWEGHPDILAGNDLDSAHFLTIFEGHPYLGNRLKEVCSATLEQYVSD